MLVGLVQLIKSFDENVGEYIRFGPRQRCHALEKAVEVSRLGVTAEGQVPDPEFL